MARLKWIKAEFFKGCREAEYPFAEKLQIIRGKNGTGKTTILDMWLWLITDKQADLQSNPEVHPDFAQDSEPTVEAGLDIDGKTVVLRKYQKDMRTKKQKEENVPVRISNKYEINGVPKTQKDFIKALEEYGIDVENFALLTHPNVFVSMKSADCRKILFGTVPDITDKDVADTLPECVEARELLKDYKSDEIIATKKASLKRASEMGESIPQQIIGMEKSKVKVNPALPSRRKELEEQIEALRSKLAEMEKALDTSVYDAKIRDLENRKVTAYNEVNRQRLQKLQEVQSKYSQVSAQCNDINSLVSKLQREGGNLNLDFKRYGNEKRQAEADLQTVNKNTFSAKEVCPVCGQKIPKAKIDKAREQWEKEQQSKITFLQKQIEDATAEMEKIRVKAKDLSAKKKTAEEDLAKAEAEKKSVREEMAKYETAVTPDTREIEAEIMEVKGELVDINIKTEAANEVRGQLRVLLQELEMIVQQQAREENNKYIDDNIAAMKEEQRRYAQVKADAEKILYQMQLIGRKKNELLTDTVNSHFSLVKFKLFEVQKNGEVKDACVPMVKCSDGVYRDMRYSANTAAIEAAKIDICSGLQKCYGQNLPIFLDGAECFDTESMKNLQCDSQLILLCVSDDEGLVFE